jgi:hypothetical protein
MYNICIVSVFKNEMSALDEWLNHYINQGVDHFFLTDNGSDDEYMRILSKYIQAGVVTLNINATKHQQMQHLNFFLDDSKQYEWVIVVDLDEFMYAKNGFATIAKYLSQVDANIDQIHIPWKNFGSNGHIIQPDSIRHNFLMREYTTNFRTVGGKSITRTKNLKYILVHFSWLEDETRLLMTSDGIQTTDTDNFHISDDILANSCLHLNHYAIQSWDWFRTIKMTRGDVAAIHYENMRDRSYFEKYDNNIVFDDSIINAISHINK